MPNIIEDIPQKVTRIVVDHANTKNNTVRDENANVPSSDSTDPEDDCKIDKLFYRICNFCFFLGVNFYRTRSLRSRSFSMVIAIFTCCVNFYFVGYVLMITLSSPFEPQRIAFSISICSWVLQATLSTIFLAHWQYTSQPLRLLKLLYETNKGAGIHRNRKSLVRIVNSFYIVIALCLCYYMTLIIGKSVNFKIGYTDEDIEMIFGDRRLLIFVQMTSLYCKLCWAIAIYTYCLLIISTDYEFDHFNEQIRSISEQNNTDESLCEYLLKMMKIHNRLTECVKCLDQMFNRYTFVMMITIIPTTIFCIFIVFRRPRETFSTERLFMWPLLLLCVFTFRALVNAPSRLHNTIYSSKSALCANTHIWYPYRPDVYHSALAFACHLDQTNLGVSIWGFAVLSKPLVLTTISAMVTCLAFFLQVGDCSTSYRPAQDMLKTAIQSK